MGSKPIRGANIGMRLTVADQIPTLMPTRIETHTGRNLGPSRSCSTVSKTVRSWSVTSRTRHVSAEAERKMGTTCASYAARVNRCRALRGRSGARHNHHKGSSRRLGACFASKFTEGGTQRVHNCRFDLESSFLGKERERVQSSQPAPGATR